MNAITVVNPTQAPAPAFTMGDMERVALAIAKGGLFGSNDPNAVLTLCLLAQAEGKHPALVMQQYHIISGKPAKKADAMLVDFLASGGRVEWHALTDECADATFSHPAGGSVRISWDKARVTQAQLGNNPMHKKYPRQMLRARVISEGVRTVFPGATSGLYVPEEVVDFDSAPARNVTPPAPQAKRARDMAPATISDPAASHAPPPQAETGGHSAAGEAPQEISPRDAAVQWIDGTLRPALIRCDTAEDVDALAEQHSRAIAKLSRTFPDLAEQVQGEIGRLRASFAPAEQEAF